MSMELHLNDILELKKDHPCGSRRWQVLRGGMDIKLAAATRSCSPAVRWRR